MSSQPLCAVSIDLDSVACYYRIHALGRPPPAHATTIIERCAPRFAELFAQRGIPATFFVVASDIDYRYRAIATHSAAVITELAEKGHEIANHSYQHHYDLARKPATQVFDDIQRAHQTLSTLVGKQVVGFRAPGYDLSPAIVHALEKLGYTYDSSIFPAPIYYLAKAITMLAMRARGQPSGAVTTNFRTLAASAEPYRPEPSAPWRRGGSSLVEFPVAVTPWLRAPITGTSLLLAPRVLRRRLVAAMTGRTFFNFELHGIDLADADTDSLPDPLVAKQPDLRISLAKKRRVLGELLDEMARRFQFIRLDSAAQRISV